MTSENSANSASPDPSSGSSSESSSDRSPHTFQVDLRGLVDLLSHHLYSSPRVYLRELLQDAVDAITARRAEQPDAPALVRLHTSGGRLRIEDSGIGLTEADVHSLLATIGRSSKRDGAQGLASARAEFLGQFGIGLLACFVVAAEIRVVSRSARTPGAPPVEWCARDDGSYTVRTLPDSARAEPGTTVHLVARPGSADWLDEERVLALARDFGSSCRTTCGSVTPRSPRFRRRGTVPIRARQGGGWRSPVTAMSSSGSRRSTRSIWICRSPGSAVSRTSCRRP